MPSFVQLTAALALAGAVFASPIQLDKRSAFSIEQVPRSRYLKNGPQQRVRALRKHGKAVPAELLKAATLRANMSSGVVTAATGKGTVPAVPEDEYDSAYLSPVTVGNTTVHLDFDTGSSDLWLYSSLQARSQLTGHDYYTVDSSKVKSGYSWRLSYGDGSGASGKVYADKVTVGGVTATSQAVEAADTVSASFTQDTQLDGLLGLAMSSINTVFPVQQKTFFDNVKSSLAKPLFAVALKYHAAGTYDFGHIDTTKYTGALTYVTADASQGFWGFDATAYSVGTTTTSASISGIVDTGTTLIYTDPAVVRAYYAQVSGSEDSAELGGYIFPCAAALPDFSITIGGAKQTVRGQYVNYATVGDGFCYGGIQEDTGIGFSIFGDIFLKSLYVVFESGGPAPRLGFAQQAGV
ncbi:aspartic protease PEP1 [Decorospora gaudefroyi]|uniref:Aspartic protease PEP1 n=1 Tax=Decorospora gaudefroyi TaxID=184978 RepID=A0A6A5KF48_9PLEO|nr:aspartic protease PEP1 [Decorospora gaudefroyi]